MASNPTYAEKQRRKALLGDWVARYGWFCPGWGVPPHPAGDLEADHVVARYWGGETGPIQVLCHACNNRKRYGGRR